MLSFDLVRPPSTEVLLVYGLAAWRKRGQMVHFRVWRRVPGCHRQLLCSSLGTGLLLNTRTLGTVKERLLPVSGLDGRKAHSQSCS